MDHVALHHLVLAAQRRRLRTPRRRLGPREDRPDRTPEELIQYLREKEISSARDLNRKRQAGEPNVYDIARKFGSFNTAMLQAFGPRKPPTADPPHDAQYIVRCVTAFGLNSYRKYLRARRMRPDVVPSINQVRRQFRTVDNLFFIAQRLSLKGNIEGYIALRRRLGRRPTVGECEAAGVGLVEATKFFGNTWAVDRFMKDCIEAQERQEQAGTTEVNPVANSA
jgi:hypothetical protein